MPTEGLRLIVRRICRASIYRTRNSSSPRIYWEAGLPLFLRRRGRLLARFAGQRCSDQLFVLLALREPRTRCWLTLPAGSRLFSTRSPADLVRTFHKVLVALARCLDFRALAPHLDPQ